MVVNIRKKRELIARMLDVGASLPAFSILIPMLSAFAIISFLFLIPTVCANLAASFFASSLTTSFTLKTRLSVYPDG